MSQCHDDYRELHPAPQPGEAVQVTQCHDPLEIRVLVAESDLATRSAIGRALRADQRFGAVSEVATGDDAVCHALEVDVVLVDLRFVGGLGALGAISRIARRPGRPLIIGLSRRGEEWLSLAARCEGADDVLEWPEDEPALAERLMGSTGRAYTPVGTPVGR